MLSFLGGFRWKRAGLLVVAIGLGVTGCSDEEERRAVGEPCAEEHKFICSADDEGNKTGQLLICNAGKFELALECGDIDGCFTEASNTIGRCFHGDGTGQKCQSLPAMGTPEPTCCTFHEPNLDC